MTSANANRLILLVQVLPLLLPLVAGCSTDGPTDVPAVVTSYHADAVRRSDGTDGSFVEVFVASGSGGLSGPFDLQFVPEPTVTTALASGALLLWALYALQLRASRGVSR